LYVTARKKTATEIADTAINAQENAEMHVDLGLFSARAKTAPAGACGQA
jgi:hypothetical protein